MFSISGRPCSIDDYCITNMWDGRDTLKFEMSSDHPDYSRLIEEALVSEQQDYIVKKINGSAMSSVSVTCELDLRDFTAIAIEDYDNTSAKLEDTVPAFLPEGWTFINAAGNKKYRTIRVDYGTALDGLDKCSSLYDIVWRFDNRAKTLTAVDPHSYSLSAAFVTEAFNLRSIQYYGDSTGLVTRLICRGKNGMTFAEINDGKDYVENHQYSNKIVYGWFVDERYINPESLLEDATDLINKMSAPSRSYECDVVDMKEIEPDKYSAQDMALFNVVSLKIPQRNEELEYQVVQKQSYPHYPERNVVTLSTSAPNLKSKLQEIESEIPSIRDIESQIDISSAIDVATRWITGGDGGNVFIIRNDQGQPIEIIIIDSDGIGTAKNVWRWNIGGFGHSSTGYEGPYKTAITQDGRINAGFITTGRFEVSDAKGNVTFFADADTGEVKTHASSVEYGSSNVQSELEGLSDAVQTNTEDLTNYVSATNAAINDLQNQIDGSITTWFFAYEPAANNAPADEWTTTELKNIHLGDLFYDTDSGYCYRWQLLNGSYLWSRISDSDITKALADAATAQDTADSKRRTFTNTPVPPYDVGDLWAQGSSGDLMRCKTAKAVGQSYAVADWEKASKYTDDTAVNALSNRVITAETAIDQNAKEIKLRATKTEVDTALETTKAETQALIDLAAENVKVSVSETVTETVAGVEAKVDDNQDELNNRLDSLQNTTDDNSKRLNAAEESIDNNRANTQAEIIKLTNRVDASFSSTEAQINVIRETLENGVDKVTTTTGYSFGADGLKVNKSGSEMSTLIDEDGMDVTRSGENVLTADSTGVNAVNLTARQFLTIGTNSRFEDYKNVRTACFYIGG